MANELKSINKAGLGKRLISIIMDGVVTLFVWLFLAVLVFENIADSAFGYSEKQEKFYEHQIFSKLCVYEEKVDGNYKIINNTEELENRNLNNLTRTTLLDEYNFDSIDEYKNRLEYYYCSYLTNQNIVFPKGYPEPILTIENSEGIEVSNQEWFDENIKNLTDKDKILEACKNAEIHFYKTKMVRDLDKDVKWIQVFIFATPFVLSFGVFYILIPLLNKNGETLAKKVTHIAVISFDTYSVKKRQIVFRQLLLMFYIILAMIIYGIGTTSFATLGVAIVIYLLVIVFNKNNRSIVDYAAYTLLVDSSKSVWFNSPEEENEKEKSIKKNLSKLKKYEPDNKHVIQVGSKIVDEDIKKELNNTK